MPTMNSRLPRMVKEAMDMADAKEVEEDISDYKAIYKALNFFGADGLTNTLNTITSDGWSIYKIFFNTGPNSDSGIVVFEKWEEVTSGTIEASSTTSGAEVSGEDTRHV